MSASVMAVVGTEAGRAQWKGMKDSLGGISKALMSDFGYEERK